MRNRLRTRDSILLLINAMQLLIYGIVFFITWINNYHDIVYFYRKGNWLLTIVFLFLFMLFASLYDGFSLTSNKTGDLTFSQIISSGFSLFCIYLIACFVKKRIVEFKGIFIIFVVLLIVILITNLIIRFAFIKFVKPLKALYIYAGESNDVLKKLQKYQSNYFFVSKTSNIENNDIDSIFLSEFDCVFISGLDAINKNDIINLCYQNRKQFYLLPSYNDVIIQCSNECNLLDIPLLNGNRFGPSQFEKIIKRCMDIVFSVTCLIVTLPIMLVVAIAIKIEDNGPVFYKQTRLTQYKRPFCIYKFRSMCIDAEKDGVQFAKSNDNRITKVGKVIRACRFDELPQLFNILKGDMSVVGPRPERPEIREKIIRELPEFDYRLNVKAGLTGFAQVYGKYNTELKDKLLFDLIYIEKYSLFLDIKIMFLTFKILFSKESTDGYE